MRKKTHAQLKRKLWPIFSLYIRRRDKGICFTCGKRSAIPECDAGHFIPRGAGGLALFFHPDNVHTQCKTCNLFLQGNQYEYGKRLGEEKVKELYKLKQQITKDFPFEELIEKYTKLCAKIEQKDI